jgi:hypothetical protein
MCPFPSPYESRFPRLSSAYLEGCIRRREAAACLYANGDVRKDPHVNLGPFDGFDFALYDLFGGRELFGCETDAVALDANAPVSVGERGALDGAADGDGYDALVPLDELHSARSELMPESQEWWAAMLWRRRCLRPQGGAEEGTEREEHVGLCNWFDFPPEHARLSSPTFLFILHS